RAVNFVRAHADVVAAGGRERLHADVDGDFAFLAELGEFIVHDVAGGDATAGRIDAEDHGFDLVVLFGDFQFLGEIDHGAVALEESLTHVAGGQDARHVDDGDLVGAPSGAAFIDDLLDGGRLGELDRDVDAAGEGEGQNSRENGE